VPRRYLRSDVYRRIVGFDRRHQLSDRIGRLWRAPATEAVIQDVEIPIDKLGEFLSFCHAEIGVLPVWLCPVQTRDERHWPLYPMDPATVYVNVGFWATVPMREGEPDGTRNRLIERTVTELGGHKSLYSTSFYSSEEFSLLYNGDHYQKLKRRYDPRGRMPDLYDKCVRGR
jgi:FAD/FMN-containing dehydrogenase